MTHVLPIVTAIAPPAPAPTEAASARTPSADGGGFERALDQAGRAHERPEAVDRDRPRADEDGSDDGPGPGTERAASDEDTPVTADDEAPEVSDDENDDDRDRPARSVGGADGELWLALTGTTPATTTADGSTEAATSPVQAVPGAAGANPVPPEQVVDVSAETKPVVPVSPGDATATPAVAVAAASPVTTPNPSGTTPGGPTGGAEPAGPTTPVAGTGSPSTAGGDGAATDAGTDSGSGQGGPNRSPVDPGAVPTPGQQTSISDTGAEAPATVASAGRPATPVATPDTGAEAPATPAPGAADTATTDEGPAPATGIIPAASTPVEATGSASTPTPTAVTAPTADTGPATPAGPVGTVGPGPGEAAGGTGAVDGATSEGDGAEPVWRQVRRAMANVRTTTDGDQQVTIRLRPEGLGSVTVRVSTGESGTSVSLTADTTAAAAQLRDQRQHLVGELEGTGQRIALDIGTADRSPGQDPGRFTPDDGGSRRAGFGSGSGSGDGAPGGSERATTFSTYRDLRSRVAASNLVDLDL